MSSLDMPGNHARNWDFSGFRNLKDLFPISSVLQSPTLKSYPGKEGSLFVMVTTESSMGDNGLTYGEATRRSTHLASHSQPHAAQQYYQPFRHVSAQVC